MGFFFVCLYFLIAMLVARVSWEMAWERPGNRRPVPEYIIGGLFWPLGLAIFAAIGVGTLVLLVADAVKKWSKT